MADGQNTAVLAGLLKGVAPVLATALGPAGPLAAVALSFLSSKLGVPVDKVQETIAGMTPDQMIQLKQIDNDFELHKQQLDLQIPLAQIQLNATEAEAGKNLSGWMAFFVSGWRPAIGWTGASGLAYQFLLMPLANGILNIFHVTGQFPNLDIKDLLTITLNLLGFGAMRSWDKNNGNGNGH